MQQYKRKVNPVFNVYVLSRTNCEELAKRIGNDAWIDPSINGIIFNYSEGWHDVLYQGSYLVETAGLEHQHNSYQAYSKEDFETLYEEI